MAKKYLKLGSILKRLLFDRDMKCIDLAREINIPAPTIHRIMTGKSTRPYRSSLKSIADYFSVTIEQLIGEKSLDTMTGATSASTDIVESNINTIPIKEWDSLKDNQASENDKNKIIVTNNISKDAFALTMPDTSMEPLFPRNSILIFEPGIKPVDRSYVLVKLNESNTYVFRQLLVDLDHQYLKPLNPDLSAFKMRLLEENDSVLACLVESRHNFNFRNNNIGSIDHEK